MINSLVIIAFGLVTALHLMSLATGNSRLRTVTKVFLMPLLLLFYLLTASSISYFVVAALVCSTLGDVFLLRPQRPSFFVAGAASFGLAHLAYVLHIISYFTYSQLALWARVGAAVLLLLVVATVYGLLFSIIPRNMRFIVLGYALLIGSMGYVSLLRLVYAPGIVTGVGLLGAVFFMTSDTVLATNIFGKQSSEKSFIVMATYIAAQSMLVSSFLL